MAEALKLDPEVAALLREVAADPHSSLLRARPLSQQVDLFQREETWSSRSWMLNHAEAELVRVHREQLAWVLRELCLKELYEPNGAMSAVNPYDRYGRRKAVASNAEIARQVELAQRLDTGGSDELTAFALISAMRERTARIPQVADLAVVAHRLVPSNQARLIAAIDYARRDRPQTAISLAMSVLNAPATPENRSTAWECIGYCHAERRVPTRAFEAYVRGNEACPHQPVSLLQRLVFGTQLGLKSDALQSARRLNEYLGGEHPTVDRIIGLQLDALRRGHWSPSVEGRALAASLASSVGGTAERIARVFET